MQPSVDPFERGIELVLLLQQANGFAQGFVQIEVASIFNNRVQCGQGLLAERLAMIADPPKFVGIVSTANVGELTGNNVLEVLLAIPVDELLNERPLQPQHFEQAEIQLIVIELEHFTQQALELLKGCVG